MLIAIHFNSTAQQSVLFEGGPSYFTNSFSNNCNCLNDFIAVTVNTRLFAITKPNAAFAFEFPFSLSSRLQKDVMTRFALHIPVLFVYSYGAGASAIASTKKMGFTGGVGWGYFYQQAKSKSGELPAYSASASVNGPEMMLGVRFPVYSIDLFKINSRTVHPSVAIKFTDLFSLNSRQQDIGSLSILIGLVF
jgi:hypothetical protein